MDVGAGDDPYNGVRRRPDAKGSSSSGAAGAASDRTDAAIEELAKELHSALHRAESVVAENDYERQQSNKFETAIDGVMVTTTWLNVISLVVLFSNLIFQTSHLVKFFRGQKLIT